MLFLKVKNALLVLFMIAICFTLLGQSKEGEFRKLKRFLIDGDQEKNIQDICKKGTDSIREYYITGVYPWENEEDSIKIVEKDDDIKTVIGLIDGSSSTKDLVKYGVKNIIWFIFIILAFLSIPGFAFCWCCCICPCCCCKQKNESETCCRLFSLVMFLFFSVVLIVASIVGYIKLNGLMKGLNGATCSIMKMYSEIIDGQEISTIPKWAGIKGIEDTLYDLKSTVNLIQRKTTQLSNAKTKISDTIQEHEQKISTSYSRIDPKTITFNNPKTSQDVTITPTYINEYGDYTDSNTSLNLINLEYTLVMNQGKSLIEKTAESASYIGDKAGDISDDLDQVRETVDGFREIFDSFSDSVITPWLKYQDKIDDYGRLILNCLFGLFLFFGAGMVGFALIIVFCRARWLKIVILIFWNVVALLGIVTLLLGSILGFVGTLGKTATNVMGYVVSEENLKKGENADILPGEASESLLICIHEDGDLSRVFNLDTPGEEFTEIYNLKDILDTIEKTLEENSESQVCPEINEKYTQFKEEYLIATAGESQDNDLTVIVEFCNEKISSNDVKDLWVTNRLYCKEGYKYKRKEDNSDPKEKNCLVFNEWEADNANDRYKELNPEGVETIKKCINAFQSFEESNNQILDKIIKENNDLSSSFTKSIGILKDQTSLAKEVIDPVQTIFSGLLGEGSKAFSIINCGFLGKHIQIVIKELKDSLGKNFYEFGLLTAILGTSSVFSVAFLIIVLNRFNKGPRPKKKKVQEKPNDSAAIPIAGVPSLPLGQEMMKLKENKMPQN